jgi:hypothetical protein
MMGYQRFRMSADRRQPTPIAIKIPTLRCGEIFAFLKISPAVSPIRATMRPRQGVENSFPPDDPEHVKVAKYVQQDEALRLGHRQNRLE